MTIRTIIVDDEVWARKRLHDLLEDEDDCDVVAECADGESAIRAIRAAGPDVVFLDVQMPDMTGCDVLDAIAPARSPVVVFVTAYERYAVEAFEREAADYLLKPFDEMRFRDAVARARRDVAARLGEPAGGGDARRRRFLRRLALPRHGRVVFADVADVESIDAAGNYVSIAIGGETHLMRVTLAALEQRLDPEQFVRIHRSTIVNWPRVREVRPWSRGEQTVVLQSGRELTIGRRYRALLADRIGTGRP
jgi:two-component system LytT family response regulator